MGDFIEDFRIYMEPSEVPELYNNWLALSALASAAQRKIWFDGGTIKVSPNLYIILVADAGLVRKSYAMSVVQEKLVMRVKAIKTNSDKITKEQMFVEMKESMAQFEFKPPIQIGDRKMDRMMHCSYTLYANEMSVFMDDEKLAAAITSLYDCREIFKDSTKNKGIQHLIFPYLNILGNTTPDWISNKMQEDLLEGGLVARTMLLYANQPKQRNPFPQVTPEMELALMKMILRLEQICLMGGPFQFTAECKTKFEMWYHIHYKNQPTNTKMIGFFNRKPVHLVKVAMLLSLARKNALTLDTSDFDEALVLLDTTTPAIEESLSGVGRNVLTATSRAMLEQIASQPDGTIEIGHLYKLNAWQLQTVEFEEILKSLQMQRRIVVSFEEKSKTQWVTLVDSRKKSLPSHLQQ